MYLWLRTRVLSLLNLNARVPAFEQLLSSIVIGTTGSGLRAPSLLVLVASNSSPLTALFTSTLAFEVLSSSSVTCATGFGLLAFLTSSCCSHPSVRLLLPAREITEGGDHGRPLEVNGVWEDASQCPSCRDHHGRPQEKTGDYGRPRETTGDNGRPLVVGTGLVDM